MLMLAFNIQLVKASETIYIRTNGKVEPDTAPIQRDGNVYTFTDNINDSIVVERNNIIVDGAGYTLQGTGSGRGIDLSGRSNIIIKNVKIKAFHYGIDLSGSSSNTIQENSITNNSYGIHLVYSSNNVISENNVTYNTHGVLLYYQSNNNSLTGNNMTNNGDGIGLGTSSNNKFYHNHLTNNTQQVDIQWLGYANIWDDGYPSGGNYWSDYTGVDDDGDGIGDTPYIIDSDNTDRYPLMASYIIPEDTPLPTISILSPENKRYSVNDVPLTFTVSESTSWIGYSLDGQANVTITGNTTLSELPDGSHSLIVYANDTAGNIGYSDSVYFSIETQQAEFSPMWVVVAIAIITGIGVALVVYFAHERIGLRLRPFFVLRYAFARDV